MKIERVELSKLAADPANVRKHNAKNLKAIEASLRRFGQQKPIVVDGDGIVRAGNGTLAAAQQLGWTHIDIVRTALKGADATAYAIADNRTAELAEWDEEALAQQLASIQIEDEDLAESCGFDDLGDIEKLQSSLESDDKSSSVGEVEYRVVVSVTDEHEQATLVERLEKEGYECRLLMS